MFKDIQISHSSPYRHVKYIQSHCVETCVPTKYLNKYADTGNVHELRNER